MLIQAYRFTVLACRDWLEGLAPTDVWGHARDAERHRVDPDYMIDVASLVARLQSPGELDRALAGLPDVDRIAVVLRDAIGFSLTECQSITHAPREVMLTRLRRGRRTLLHALSIRPDSGHGTQSGLDIGCARTRAVAGPRDSDDEGIASNRSAADRHCRTCPRCDSLVAGLTAVARSLAGHEPTPAPRGPRC